VAHRKIVLLARAGDQRFGSRFVGEDMPATGHDAEN
jgi:hypothetical protein